MLLELSLPQRILLPAQRLLLCDRSGLHLGERHHLLLCKLLLVLDGGLALLRRDAGGAVRRWHCAACGCSNLRLSLRLSLRLGLSPSLRLCLSLRARLRLSLGLSLCLSLCLCLCLGLRLGLGLSLSLGLRLGLGLGLLCLVSCPPHQRHCLGLGRRQWNTALSCCCGLVGELDDVLRVHNLAVNFQRGCTQLCPQHLQEPALLELPLLHQVLLLLLLLSCAHNLGVNNPRTACRGQRHTYP